MYTLEINGEPIAIINASKDEARQHFTSDELKAYLLCFHREDSSVLWDGVASLLVRRSLPEEVTRHKATYFNAKSSGAPDAEDDDGFLVFLLPVRDPLED